MSECEINISGILINFPFQPYAVQRSFMEEVIDCLRNRKNGILESPCGTGKTLALLCSTLAWLKSRECTNCVPKIIYATRTHEQILQAMKELKRTVYTDIKTIALGSRNELCINDNVKKQSQSSITRLCKQEQNKCSYFEKLNVGNPYELQNQEIMDIEDLKTSGEQLKMCPYYGSQKLINDAKIIFMPYNYLFDLECREKYNIELSGNIIICDEAHNIPDICEESVSHQLFQSDVVNAIQDLEYDGLNLLFEGEVLELNGLYEKLNNLNAEISTTTIGQTFGANYIYDLLESVNITAGSGCHLELLYKLQKYFLTDETSTSRGENFVKIAHFLKQVFLYKMTDWPEVRRSFKVHIGFEVIENEQQNVQYKIIEYYCLSPLFSMKNLLTANTRNVILTSGNLFEPTIAQLSNINYQIPDVQIFRNPHSVTHHIYAQIINRENGVILESTLKKREESEYIDALGKTILKASVIVPDGMLVFFPSYAMLQNCLERWQREGLFNEIQNNKLIFNENCSNSTFGDTLKEYKQTISKKKAACLMCVYRGKASEGLNFADREVRGIILAGLPLPPISDTKVKLKKIFLNDNCIAYDQVSYLNGDLWYELQAYHAVNAAIGRIKRHDKDYGVILFCDNRFSDTWLSPWVATVLERDVSELSEIEYNLRRFLADANVNFPPVINRED